MKALILSAGLGKRLRPLTEVLPKPLLPILNRPVLEHLLEVLKENGINDVIVNLHHLPNKIISYFGSSIQYSHEEKIMGTAGAIKKCQEFFENETFLVINGDIIADIDLKAALSFHNKKRSQLTLVVREDENLEQYKPIEIDSNGKIVRFPRSELRKHIEGTTRVMFTGAQIIEPEIFKHIPPDRLCGTTDAIYPAILNAGIPVFGFQHKGYWRDMGNRKNYLLATEDALNKKVKLIGLGKLNPNEQNIMPPVLIGQNCNVSPYSQIGPYAVLGNGCRVEEGALIENSVLWNNVLVGTGGIVKDSILGHNIIVHPKQNISKRLGVQIGFKPTLSPSE